MHNALEVNVNLSYLDQLYAMWVDTSKSLPRKFIILHAQKPYNQRKSNKKINSNVKDSVYIYMSLFSHCPLFLRPQSATHYLLYQYIALTSRRKRVLRNPLFSFLRLGNLTPLLKSESTAVKLGNPRSSLMIIVSRVGITICNAERTIFVKNVTCFASEKASSLGM